MVTLAAVSIVEALVGLLILAFFAGSIAVIIGMFRRK